MIPCSLFQTYHATNTLVIIVLALEMGYAFGLVYASCEFGQQIFGLFNQISDTIDQIKWYRFPIRVQRMLPTIAIFAQQTITLEVFGSISCSRESFKKVKFKKKLKCMCLCTFVSMCFEFVVDLDLYFQVMHSSFSYFMMLREFSNWFIHIH